MIEYDIGKIYPNKCRDCKYKNKDTNQYPCNECVHNYIDKFEPKEKSQLEILKKILREKISINMYAEKREYKVTTLRNVVSIIEELEGTND